jgi:hypothetical protein
MSGAYPHFNPSYTHEELVVHCKPRHNFVYFSAD